MPGFVIVWLSLDKRCLSSTCNNTHVLKLKQSRVKKDLVDLVTRSCHWLLINLLLWHGEGPVCLIVDTSALIIFCYGVNKSMSHCRHYLQQLINEFRVVAIEI